MGEYSTFQDSQNQLIKKLEKHKTEIDAVCRKYGYNNLVEVFNHDHKQALLMISEIIDLCVALGVAKVQSGVPDDD